MCFSFKNNFGALFFPVLKIEKFLQYKHSCGGGGVGAVRGHSECILALGWDDWGGRTPALPPNPVFFPLGFSVVVSPAERGVLWREGAGKGGGRARLAGGGPPKKQQTSTTKDPPRAGGFRM